MVNVVYGITNVPPSPDWKHMLYSFDKEKNEWKLEWVLPQHSSIAHGILLYPDGFDSFLVESIRKFFNKELLGQKK